MQSSRKRGLDLKLNRAKTSLEIYYTHMPRNYNPTHYYDAKFRMRRKRQPNSNYKR